jgi:hypothetical protein
MKKRYVTKKSYAKDAALASETLNKTAKSVSSKYLSH